MKEKIHPNYGKCIVRCVCGETFETALFLFFISTYTDTSFFRCPYMKYRFTKRDRTPCVSGCGLFRF